MPLASIVLSDECDEPTAINYNSLDNGDEGCVFYNIDEFLNVQEDVPISIDLTSYISFNSGVSKFILS